MTNEQRQRIHVDLCILVDRAIDYGARETRLKAERLELAIKQEQLEKELVLLADEKP
jgi:hypothetical protein